MIKEKSEGKLRETVYVNDGNGNFIETEIGYRRDERIEELEKRVEELERLVREIIQWKEDRIIIQLDKNGKEVGEAIHNYHIDEAQYERQFENGVAKYDLKVDKNGKVVSGGEFRELC